MASWFQAIVVFVVCWITALAQAVEPVAIFALGGPGPNDKYQSTSSVAFAGKIDPELRTEVEVQMLHRLDDNRWIPMGGVRIPIQEDGRFSGTLIPGSPGWKAGPAILRMRLHPLRHIQTERVFEVVAREGLAEDDWIAQRPVSSGVEIDVDQAKKRYRVGAGETFLVKGKFGSTAGTDRGTPPVFAELRTELNGRSLIGQSWIGPSIREEKTTYFYEIELLAPDRPAEFDLIVVPMRSTPERFFDEQRQAIPVTRVQIKPNDSKSNKN